MADNKQTDAPDKTGQAASGGDKAAPDTPAKVTAPEKSPGKQAPPASEDKAPAPGAGGKEDKAPPAGPDDKAPAPTAPGMGKIVGVEFPSGKKLEIVDGAGPSGKAAPGGDKQAPPAPAVTTEGDSLDMWNKEQAAIDAKKPGRKPRASKTAEKPDPAGKGDKPPARRGRPPKSAGAPGKKTAPAKQEAPAPAPEPPRAPVEAPGPKSRSRLSTLTCPSFTPLRITLSAFGMMRKCRRWPRASRTRA